MEQLNITGIITATSKKQSTEFATANPRKSIYFECDKENTVKAVDFGLTEYTSKQDNKNFFIVKATEDIDVYDKYGEIQQTLDGGLDTPNFSTDKAVNLAILKGESKGNTFYRLKGIQGEVQEVEAQNLFAQTSEDLPF